MIGIPYHKKVAAAVVAYPRNLAPVVEKELLHYEILKFLNANGYNVITFKQAVFPDNQSVFNPELRLKIKFHLSK